MRSGRPVLVNYVAGFSLLLGLLQVYLEIESHHGLDFYNSGAALLGYSSSYLVAATLIPIGLWLATAFGLWLGAPWGWWLSAFHYFLGVTRHLSSLYFDVVVLKVHVNPELIGSSGMGGTVLGVVLFSILLVFAFRTDVRRWAGVEGSSLPRLVGLPLGAAVVCSTLSTLYVLTRRAG